MILYKSGKVQVLFEKHCIIVIFSDYEQTNDFSWNYFTTWLSNEIIFIVYIDSFLQIISSFIIKELLYITINNTLYNKESARY